MITRTLERLAQTGLIIFVLGMGLWTMASTGIKVLIGLAVIVAVALWLAKKQGNSWKVMSAPRRGHRNLTDVPPAAPFPYGVTYVWWSPDQQPYIGKTLLHRLDERDAEHYASGRLPLEPGWTCDKTIWQDEATALRQEQIIYDDLVAQGYKPLNRMRPAGV